MSSSETVYGDDERPRRTSKREERPANQKVVARYVYHAEKGLAVRRKIRLEPGPGKRKKEFRWMHPEDDTWQYCGQGCDHEWPPYRLVELLGSTGTIFLVEGEKSADRLAHEGLTVTTTGGAETWRPENAKHFERRDVVVLRDNDGPGLKYALAVAEGLYGVAASVRIVLLPGLPEKGDPFDYFESGGTRAALEEIALAAPFWNPGYAIAPELAGAELIPRPQIEDGPDFERIYREIGETIHSTEIYARGRSVLVEVQALADDWTVREMKVSDFRRHADLYFDYMVRKGKKRVRGELPSKIAQLFIDDPAPFDDLEGVISFPTMRADGSILDTPGYDFESGLVLRDGVNVKIPETPTAEEIATAVELLKRPFTEFPFDEQSSPAQPIAAIMTAIGRAAIAGPVPGFYFGAPTPGTGKGLLSDCAAIVATGCEREGQKCSAPVEEAEWRKLLTSLAIKAPAMHTLDNIVGTIRSAAFSAMLTTGVHSDRVLGKSETVELKVRTVWMVTGNNVGFAGDLSRRFIRCGLDAGIEHPEDREFRVADLAGFVKEHRDELAAAALTILRGYHVAGRPPHGKPELGSFERWDRLVRGACIWAGLDDPDSGRQMMREAGDPDTEALGEVLRVCDELFQGGTFTTAELLRKLPDGDSDEAATVLAWAGGKKDAKAIGYAISAAADRPIGGMRFKRLGVTSGKTRWQVVKA